ncbi:MAG: glycosyltransferase family 2 protein [Saprospiraceae bacterium]
MPAFNEEKSIGKVVDDIPKELVRNIYVCNNASTDKTAIVANNHGAIVLDEPNTGYGSACLRGITEIKEQEQLPDILVFVDGDYSDYPEDMIELIRPIVKDECDMVIGSRAMGNMERGSMTPQQLFGNWLATTLIKVIYGYRFTDLGPFRAIKYNALTTMKMEDKTYGWTVEMQVKAAKMGMKCTEVPVRYRKRIGVSKISGTIKGTILAGHKILWTIFKLI